MKINLATVLEENAIENEETFSGQFEAIDGEAKETVLVVEEIILDEVTTEEKGVNGAEINL